MISVQSFRPLSGSYISQYQIIWSIRKWYLVSVPYRGATFLNTVETFYRKEARKMFPSPIGELHFSIKGYYHVLRLCKVFPSPIGELHFSIEITFNDESKKDQFPSPIGELHFSIYMSKLKRAGKCSFRPLSGSYISQYQHDHFHNGFKF